MNVSQSIATKHIAFYIVRMCTLSCARWEASEAYL